MLHVNVHFSGLEVPRCPVCSPCPIGMQLDPTFTDASGCSICACVPSNNALEAPCLQCPPCSEPDYVRTETIDHRGCSVCGGCNPPQSSGINFNLPIHLFNNSVFLV